jgi:hypothetical protein
MILVLFRPREAILTIIVEGPDAAGKTTLVRALSRKLQIPVRPRHVTSGGELVDEPMRWASNEMRAWPSITGVYDRFTLLAEPVYGPVMRGRIYEAFLSGHYMALLDAFFKTHPMVIYCLPPIQTVRSEFMRTIQEQPEWLRDALPEQRDGIWFAYQMQMMWLSTVMGDNIHVYDWTHPNSDLQFDKLISRARILIATYGRA